MTSILLVDDEIHAVEGIKSVVNWDHIGISNVFTAYDIHQAKEMFQKYPIDMMLCDIEMPEGNGLELLAWVREYYPSTDSVFLTCHADFHYAKQAIQLGSFDYLLKPVPIPELENVIVKVMAKRSEEIKRNEFSRYGQYWVQHQPLLIERFWMDILGQTIPANPDAIRQAAEERNIPYTEQMQFVPVLIAVKRWHKELNIRDEKIMEYALRNSAEEVLLNIGNYGQLITLGKGMHLAILSFECWNANDAERLHQCCTRYIASCHNYFYCDMSCYVGAPAYPYQLPAMAEKLQTLDRNNVASDNRVILLNGSSFSSGTYFEPEFHVWSAMLKEGSAERLAAEMTGYLDKITKGPGLDAKQLHQFHQDFLQLVYSFLQSKGIMANRLFSDDKSVQISVTATRSVKDMVLWIHHVVHTAIEFSNSVEQSESVVARVVAYVTKQIAQPLLRDEIAKHVFLNVDYLDRVFKKEMGVSVTEYVYRERMNVAQDLLIRTDLPVHAIATEIGYTHFSHFSRMFKMFTSKSPLEYRQEAANQPKD
ncbi:response regulator transcription factor [Paenibacillus sp. YIM B09110]|uniref:response regulator transcription factor n=1 Tax=Paenibacillus sp. YIM B09110 TaxID=3126102 RepID=UPI00301B7074